MPHLRGWFEHTSKPKPKKNFNSLRIYLTTNLVNSSISEMRVGALTVIGVLLFLSLSTAVVLFYFLDSFAQIQNQNISLGGSAAGFFIIFILLRNTYFKVSSSEKELQKLPQDEKINKLEKQIKELITNDLHNFTVPDGYISEISDEFKFGFCYPKNWVLTRYPQETTYGLVTSLNPIRNLNVVITDTSNIEFDLDATFKQTSDMYKNLFANVKEISTKKTLFQGLPAHKSIFHVITNEGQKMGQYQILAFNKKKQYLYTITFTTLQEEFDSVMLEFDSIASTFRI